MKRKETRSEIEEKIMHRAWKDPDFKKRLKSNPIETLKEFGITLPAHAKVMVHEEDQSTWHFTIRKAPPNVQNMSDQELEKLNAAKHHPHQNCAGGPF